MDLAKPAFEYHKDVERLLQYAFVIILLYWSSLV
jgi:hypothetical protein